MTDYENISIVYTCSSYLAFHISHSWIYTRNVGTQDLAPYVELLKNIGFENDNLLYTNNKDCPQ